MASCQRLWQSLQPFRSPPTVLQSECNEVLANVLLRQQDYANAEPRLKQQLHWSAAATGKVNGDVWGAYACHQMANLCREVGRISEALEFYRSALEGYLECGDELAKIMDILDELESVLEDEGRIEELARVRSQYGFIWADMDQWTLRPGAEFPGES